MKKIIAFFVLACLLCTSLASCGFYENKVKYNTAKAYIEKREYEAAYQLFKDLGSYEDSAESVKRFRYVPISIKWYVDGEFNEGATVSYNKNNLPTQVVLLDDSYEGGIECIIDYTYGSNGKPIKSVWVDQDDGYTEIVEYEYNSAGVLTKEIYTGNSGRKNITEYVYDNNGKLIRCNTEDYEGDKYVTDYTYSSNGNLIKESLTYPSGYWERWNWTYDTYGNVAEEVYEDKYGKETKTYAYQDGRLIRTIVTEDNVRKETREYLYDESGNMIKETITDSSFEKRSIDNQYDGNKNLIKQTKVYYGGDIGSVDIVYQFVYIPFELTTMTEDLFEGILTEYMLQ